MSRRHLGIIFGSLGVLLLIYLGLQVVGSTERPAAGGPDIGAYVDTTADLVRITTAEPADSIRLQLKDGVWTVNGYPADTAIIRQALADLDTARTGRLVARSISNHERLGVAEGASRLVGVGLPEEPVLQFYLGDSGREGRYVRLPDSPEVYVVAAEAVRWFDRGLDDWRDRAIASVDTAAVAWYRIRRDSDELSVSRTRADSLARWSVDGAPADSALAGRVLETVADLRASGFPSDSQILAADFDRPFAVLDIFETQPGTTRAIPVLSLLFVLPDEPPNFLVRRADRPLMYTLSVSLTRQLLPEREELLGE